MALCTKTIISARDGDELAQEVLIRDYQTRIARFVASRTGSGPHVEDLCQTIFVKMVLGLEKLRVEATFEAWLLRIAQNACRDHLRRGQGWRRLFVPFGPDHDIAADPDGAGDTGPERLALARRAMAGLSGSERDLILMAAEERRYDEMAALSGIGVPALKSRLHRARGRLKALMADLVRAEDSDA